MTPEMQRITNQLNLAAVMEGLGPRQLSQTMGAMPARGEPMGIRDQIMADMHAAAMRDFALSQREGASQEEADAGRSQLWSRLGPIVGNNQIIPGL